MEHKTHQPLLGAFWMVLAGASFAIVNTITQYLGSVLNMPSTVVAFYQYLVSLLIMLPWIMLSGLTQALKTNKLGLHIVRVLFSVIGIQFWVWALAVPVPIWQAIALVMTSPLFATLGSAVFLKEHVGAARWLATLFGFAGCLIILEPWSDSFKAATLLPVAAAFFWAGYSVMVKYMSKTESDASIVVYLLVLITPFNLLLALPNISAPDGTMWWLLLLSGSLVGLAQWAIAKAYRHADASYVQPFDLVKLPLNVLAGWLVFKYVPPGNLWLGAAMIVAATLFILYREQSREKEKTL